MQCKKCRKEIADTPYCQYCGAKQSVQRTKRGNGLGSVYKHGSTWTCQISVGFTADGKRRYRKKCGFKTKKEALLFLPEFITNQSKYTVRKNTLSYYHDSWLKTDAAKLSPSKQTAYKIAWQKLEPIHNVSVSDLSIVQLRDVVCEAAPTYYPARDMKSLLSHILKLAIADQQINVNMSEHITLPPLKESDRTAWSEDEIKAMWDAYNRGEQMAAYLILMTYTGMMPGELLNCRKDMIDFDKLQIVGAGLKTDIRKSVPIAIPAFIKPVIDVILTFTEKDYPKLICRQRDMFYIDYHAFLKRSNMRDLPMYTCRHTTASALASENISPALIQEIMRHASFQMTQHYIHIDTTTRSTTLATLNPNTKQEVTQVVTGQ